MRVLRQALTALSFALSVSTGPATAQFVEGEFASPEEELFEFIKALQPDGPDEVTRVVAAEFAPSVIIPTEPPAPGVEWAHYYGVQYDTGAPVFAFGIVTWERHRFSDHMTGRFVFEDTGMSGTMEISRIDWASAVLEITLRLDEPWMATIPPHESVRSSSRMILNQRAFEGVNGYGYGSMLNLTEARALLDGETIGISGDLRPDHINFSVMLMLGDTGRAQLEEAFAAWGLIEADAAAPAE